MEILRVNKIDHSILCIECNSKKIWSRNLCDRCYRKKARRGGFDRPVMPVVLSDYQKEVLDGLMLGDGCLFKYKPTHNPYLAICRQYTDRAYLEYHREIFEPFIVQPIIDKFVFDHRTKQTYNSSRLVTRHNSAMDSVYERWYQNGIKHIPNNLILTSVVVATWFCDDGWVGFSSKSNKGLRLKMSTHGFAHDDVVALAEMLNRRYVYGFKVYKDHDASYISAAHMPTKCMLEDIAEYIPDCMSRKLACWHAII